MCDGPTRTSSPDSTCSPRKNDVNLALGQEATAEALRGGRSGGWGWGARPEDALSPQPLPGPSAWRDAPCGCHCCMGPLRGPPWHRYPGGDTLSSHALLTLVARTSLCAGEDEDPWMLLAGM